MATAQLSAKNLRYINSISFKIAMMSKSQSTQSLRILLSTMPFKPVKGQQGFPQTSLTTITDEKDQSIEVTYSDKKKQIIKANDLSVADLIRKIEASAKQLRAKEEGI